MIGYADGLVQNSTLIGAQIYRLEDEGAYAGERAAKPGRSFREWRTHRMSDHLPMWIELGIDDADAYLGTLA